MSIHISSAFDAGAIEVVSIETDASIVCDQPTARIRLRLRPDNASDFRQWFYFRLQGAAGVRCILHLENCVGSAYPEGWRDYRAVASNDRQRWVRVPSTHFDGSELRIEWTPVSDSAYLAYFEPYSFDRHLAMLSRLGADRRVRVSRLGATLDGRDLDLVAVGEAAPGRKKVWVIARQHPGETMAEWFVEGMLDRLLALPSERAAALLDRAVFYVVPNMNPDGSVRGNLRTNAAGKNLNRAWLEPSLADSPEVFWVRERMKQTGVDFFLDVHGDETLPYVFIDGSTMLPGRSRENIDREARFIEAVKRHCPDFQTEQGYHPDRFNDELLTLASKYVGHIFGCLSVTLEMPFKDNANRPDPTTGWDGARSYALGGQILDAIWEDIVG